MIKTNSKVKLNIDDGPIVFLGGMNAMPMMYAWELKKMGYEVIYFVDRPENDTLSRPENHFPNIKYPYPDWIIEVNLKTQILLPFFVQKWGSFFLKKIKKISQKKPQLFVLNGFFISIGPFFVSKGSQVIALSHGSDLDTWADVESISALKKTFSKKSFFKYFPSFFSSYLISYIVKKQFNSLLCANAVIYFPTGFNSNGDRVINKLREKSINIFERYDISFEPLEGQNRDFKKRHGKLVIFSGVRFLYQTFPDGNEEYSKGNDIIIKGLAKFYKHYPEIEIHFVEKGEDVEAAKQLCKELGLSSAVVWHKEMKFYELLRLYQQSDICFDQVGKHWIGAIGGYALWLGKPLIANDERPVRQGLWSINNPILSAQNEVEVFKNLEYLKNDKLREAISLNSKKFVEEYMSPKKLLLEVFVFGKEI